MTLPPASYHAKAVTLGYMVKRKEVSSRASLLIFVKVLVGNTISSGHHAKAISPNYLLNKKEKKKNKGRNGLGKNAYVTGTTRLLQRHPHPTLFHPWPLLHPHAWTSPDHITHLHGLDEVFLGNFLFLWTLAQ
jgi:hypothetical protein